MNQSPWAKGDQCEAEVAAQLSEDEIGAAFLEILEKRVAEDEARGPTQPASPLMTTEAEVRKMWLERLRGG